MSKPAENKTDQLLEQAGQLSSAIGMVCDLYHPAISIVALPVSLAATIMAAPADMQKRLLDESIAILHRAFEDISA